MKVKTNFIKLLSFLYFDIVRFGHKSTRGLHEYHRFTWNNLEESSKIRISQWKIFTLPNSLACSLENRAIKWENLNCVLFTYNYVRYRLFSSRTNESLSKTLSFRIGSSFSLSSIRNSIQFKEYH